MPRLSLKKERAEQILDAFERCVVKYGVDGAALQRIADEAGLTRSLLRHHVGNREELLEALVARFSRRGEQEATVFESYLPRTGRVKVMIDLMFDARYQSSSRDVLLLQALVMAAQTRPALKVRVQGWYDDYLEAIRQELHQEYPQAPDTHISAAAVGILALYFNVDSMTPITNDQSLYADSRLAAHKLVESL